MITTTLGSLIDIHGVDVDDHLDRADIVPVHAGLQFQGDVAVIPDPTAPTSDARPIPTAGIAVVHGENGGNTHLLLADPTVMWAPAEARGRDIATLTVPDGATAWLAHPEHGYLGIGPGTYRIRRQREQADVVRFVAD